MHVFANIDDCALIINDFLPLNLFQKIINFKIKNKSVLVNIVDYRTTDEARELINILINNLSLNICIIMNNIDGKNSIVGATDEQTELDISVYIQKISEELGGGASKDPNFSIGGGPKKYDLKEAVKILTDTLNDDLS